MITEDYVSFEVAKLLKEKGFAEPCIGFYNPIDGCFFEGSIRKSWDYNRHGSINAPTHQMVMKWLREKHKIGIFPRQYHVFKERALSDDFEYGVEILKLGSDMPLNPSRENMPDKKRFFIFKSYEQACEAAIKYCLENLI